MLETHKALLEKKGKYLVLLRPQNCHRYADCWDLPGGKTEENENPRETLGREIREEIGLPVELGEVIYKFEIESDCVKNATVKFFLHRAKLLDAHTEIKLSAEHITYAWLTLEEIGQLAKREIVLDNYVRSLNK